MLAVDAGREGAFMICYFFLIASEFFFVELDLNAGKGTFARMEGSWHMLYSIYILLSFVGDMVPIELRRTEIRRFISGLRIRRVFGLVVSGRSGCF